MLVLLLPLYILLGYNHETFVFSILAAISQVAVVDWLVTAVLQETTYSSVSVGLYY